MKFNIEYRITKETDGRWVVRSFDSNGNQLGGAVFCKDAHHAWEVWAVLNGYSHLIPEEQILANEDTTEIDISKVGA